MEQLERENLPCRLVEFYDCEYLENIISLEHGPYSSVTYVYFTKASEPDRLTRNALRNFLQSRLGIIPDFLAVKGNSVSFALEAFEKLTREENCDFDLTGGSSVFIAAAGTLLGKYPDRMIHIHEYDPSSGLCLFRYPNENRFLSDKMQLTIQEIMNLQKVQIMNSFHPIRYRFHENKLDLEIMRLWEVVRKHAHAWNVLTVLETVASEGCIQKKMNWNQWKCCKSLLMDMERHGLISNLQMKEEDTIQVSYFMKVPENAMVLYEKGGNFLEFMTYLALHKSNEFGDCCTGIMLDWELGKKPQFGNPVNEVDVLGIRGTIPYFISCKNTQVKNEFLYEILTITRHFGGRYAVPALATTALCTDTIRTRAQEMGILLIDHLSVLTADKFFDKVQKILCMQ